MKRLALVLALVALAAIPATPPACATPTTSDRAIALQLSAFPQTIRPGQIGTWVATRIGEWQPGTLSIYVLAQIDAPSYTSTPAGIVCTMAQSAAVFSLECDAPAGSATVVLIGQLVIASPTIHSVACADDQADTLLAEDWQFTTGTARRYLPLVLRQSY
jgi:hypothetical protein